MSLKFLKTTKHRKWSFSLLDYAQSHVPTFGTTFSSCSWCSCFTFWWQLKNNVASIAWPTRAGHYCHQQRVPHLSLSFTFYLFLPRYASQTNVRECSTKRYWRFVNRVKGLKIYFFNYTINSIEQWITPKHLKHTCTKRNFTFLFPLFLSFLARNLFTLLPIFPCPFFHSLNFGLIWCVTVSVTTPKSKTPLKY